MSRDFKVYLEDIFTSAEKIEKYTSGLSYEDLLGDDKTFDAVLRNLEILGEAAKKVPQDIQKKHAEIEWSKLAGLRDILIHQYFGVDAEIIWDIIKNKLPELKKTVCSILSAHD